jgi:hypothetical protein
MAEHNDPQLLRMVMAEQMKQNFTEKV